MFLIIGLGNPGGKYKDTRHNAGAMAIDELKLLNPENVILAKPDSFMNESGKAVKKLVKTHNLTPANLIIIHDDIDLPLGIIRIAKNRGAAGHKGVESIINGLETNDFIRIRIGIQPKSGKPKNPETFVLQKFNKQEEKTLKEVFQKTVEAAETILKKGLEIAMNEFNK